MPTPPPTAAGGGAAGRPAGRGPVEVADRVWMVTDASGTNATVVAGAGGVVVVDTLGTPGAGRDLADAVRRLARGDLVGVVLTHGHEPHTGGLAGLLDGARTPVPVVVHEAAADRWDVTGAGAGDLRPLSSVAALDLGDRVVEVVHPGPGHSPGDVVVRVPDADLLVVGDLVTGDGPPSYGADCWPLAWPSSLDLVLQLLGGSGLAVPGHGPLLERAAVEEQRDAIASVAEGVRELAGRGVPEDRALGQVEAEGSWPWPTAVLTDAVRRGYAQLPRSARQLPLA